ncbi:MAG: regulatory protein RecX [Acidobacteriota bacterium]
MKERSLLDRALQLLGLRDHTEAELARKLSRHATPPEVQAVLSQLRARGYLNDQELGYRRALYLRTRKLLGNKRIAYELQRLGLNATMIALIRDRLEDEVPEAVSLQEAVRARVSKGGLPRSRAELKRLFDYAVRLGYPPAAVRDVLEPFFAALGWDEAE